MVWALLHHRIMGGVAIEMRVVFLIEFGVVFIGGWGYLTYDTTRHECRSHVVGYL